MVSILFFIFSAFFIRQIPCQLMGLTPVFFSLNPPADATEILCTMFRYRENNERCIGMHGVWTPIPHHGPGPKIKIQTP